MRTRLLLLLLPVCTLLLPRGASAQSVPAQQSDTVATLSPQQRMLARRLIDLLRIDTAAVAGVVIMLDQQVQANPALAPYRPAMEQWARDIFASDEAKNAFTELYARSFSEADLQALVAFFQLPAGQHLAARQGDLATAGAQIGRQLALAHQADLLVKIQQMQTPPQQK